MSRQGLRRLLDSLTDSNTRQRRFPVIGQRILKTALAVFLCLLIYMARGCRGMVVQSAIAAIICMQPYTSDSRTFALNRVLGTVIGGLWGLAFLWLMGAFPILWARQEVLYLLMSLGVIAVLYSTVLMRVSGSASLAAIVFLCVIITYPDVETPLIQTGDRIFDTIIGVCVAVLVNTMHLPVKKHPEKLFFLRLQDLVEDRYSQVSPKVLIELNRRYDDGARICLTTRWAPAFLISQMGLLKINLPIIVMDGAALYDIRENTYHEVQSISHEDAEFLLDYLGRLGLCCQITSVRNNTMLFYHRGKLTPAEEEDYRIMRRSAYRSYVEGDFHEEDQLTRIRFIVADREAEHYDRLLRSDPEITGRFRFVPLPQPRMDGYTGFYFYRRDVSMADMQARLLDYARQDGAAEPVQMLPRSSAYSPDRDAPLLLHRLKRTYEQLAILALLEKLRNKLDS